MKKLATSYLAWNMLSYIIINAFSRSPGNYLALILLQQLLHCCQLSHQTHSRGSSETNNNFIMQSSSKTRFGEWIMRDIKNLQIPLNLPIYVQII